MASQRSRTPLGRSYSPAEASLDAARRQADAIAAEANRKLRTLSLGATPRHAPPRPAGDATVSRQSANLIEENAAEARLAEACRRHADAYRVYNSLPSGSPSSPLQVNASRGHAVSVRDNWGASPRALEYRAEAVASPLTAMVSTPRAAGLASPRPTPASEEEAYHRLAIHYAQQELSHSLRNAGQVAASPTAFRPTHEDRQHNDLSSYRQRGPAEKTQMSAKIAALQAEADISAKKLEKMLPARPMDAGAPITYSHYSPTGASAVSRQTQQSSARQLTVSAPAGASPPMLRKSTSTTFSSEMARSPGV